MIEACDASLVYVDRGVEIHACRNINMEIRRDEFVGILGPSGSGKSSLLYLLSGLKNPTSGYVAYNNTPYQTLSDCQRSQLRLREFGFVFQQPYLVGYLTTLENVLMAAPSNNSVLRAMNLLEKLGLADKAHRVPSELSGGEKQRVCIARALFSEPAVVFADEPTASLDHAAGIEVVELLRKHRAGALLMVTHDPTMLVGADRVFSLSEGVAIPKQLPVC